MYKSLLCVFLGTSFSAQAQQSDESTTTGQVVLGADEGAMPSGFAPFLGANVGYTDQARNVESEGMPSSLKLLGSYYLKNQKGVFDLGYGVQNQQFSRERALDEEMNAGALEAAARYQFSNRWQTGLVMNQFFEKGKNYSANQADAQFAGLQLLKDFNFRKNYIGRIGARIMTDLNVNKKTVNMAMVDFQVGWNSDTRAVSRIQTAAVEETVLDSPEPSSVASDESAKPTESEIAPSPVAQTALEKSAHFAVNSAELSDSQKDYLSKLGAALAANPDLVEEVQIVGHTDKSGSRALNSELSEKRANSVAEILRASSQGKTQVATKGLADLYPVSADQGANRRAEVIFVGVKDQKRLDELLESIE